MLKIPSKLALAILFLFSSYAVADTSGFSFNFHNAAGTQIVNSAGEAVFYKGVSFGNRVWVNDRIPTLHHGPEDFARVKSMGMNLVRFYINYKTLEDDKNPYHYLNDGWQWLDRNIQWARQNGVYLILNMHVPQGGFQSNGEGWALWKEPGLQNRLIKLWVAIASRYQNEPVVFGYDLLNEPGVPNSKQQWQSLAQRLTHAIRKVDTNHPIIIERVNSINKKWENDAELNFIRVKGENIIYTFHCYDPFYYTHQGVPWLQYMRGRDGGTWPDVSKGNTKFALEQSINRYLAWGNKHDVPLYFGEWGLYKVNFTHGRGGMRYIQDMMDILENKKITNTYHVYHEESFGIYRGDDQLDPENANHELLSFFKARYLQ